ncbi:hypothetical protein ACWGH8_13925 [Nonomuraea muscovyensis]|uniref:Uncharacterized protein n=1 Tax=Nonomuraea muscovyensis TaxID=1124761 RepID=A0A7X0C1H9_9ACTN|nr:hypothetical protein [Nonomuraea muscovyensis]MBB6346448.1 hypothetical protein [Nonomuraea muscovyensis]
MIGALGRFGDRLLERLVPSATARADTTFREYCYCRYTYKHYRTCHVVGGTTSCGLCYSVSATC